VGDESFKKLEETHKASNMTTKSEILKAYERINASKSESGCHCGLISSTLFTVLRDKENIQLAILNDIMLAQCE
jgi:hypothetical protein